MTANLAFFHWPKASRSGAFEAEPSSFIFLKAGDSFICSRIYSEIASRKIEPRNGIRQPQAFQGSSITATPLASSCGVPSRLNWATGS